MSNPSLHWSNLVEVNGKATAVLLGVVKDAKVRTNDYNAAPIAILSIARLMRPTGSTSIHRYLVLRDSICIQKSILP